MTKDDKTRRYFNAPSMGVPVLHRPAEWPNPLPADILCTSSGSAPLMKIAYGYPVRHCALCMGGWELMESLTKGPEQTNMHRYQKSRFVCASWKGITGDQRKVVVAEARKLEGLKYDYPQLGWLIARGLIKASILPLLLLSGPFAALKAKLISGAMNKMNPLDSENKIICSEEIADASRAADLPVEKMRANKGSIAPPHFLDPSLFEWKYIYAPRR